ncbi:MAG: aminoglycoside phosphotransferase family protein [Mycobacteriales bacterium]
MGPAEQSGLVSARVEALLGARVAAVGRVPGSVENRNYRARTDIGDVFVKTGPGAAMRLEDHVCALLPGLHINGPRVLAREYDGPLGTGVLVIGCLPGADAGSEPATPTALRDAGRQVRRLHEVTAPGFGQARLSAAGHLEGELPDWSGVIETAIADLPPLVEHDVIAATFAAEIRGAIEANRALTVYDGRGRLLHDDLKAGHVFTHNGELSGIIDWGDPFIGDPLFDLAPLTRTAGEFDDFFAGYGMTLDDSVRRRLTAYRVIRDVLTLHFEWAAGGDWFAVYRDRIGVDLERLGASPGPSRLSRT